MGTPGAALVRQETPAVQPVNLKSGPLMHSINRASSAIVRASDPRARSFTSLGGAVMSEPASSAAGGLAAWKLGAALLGVGIVASALGFLVLLPKSPREAAVRALATMAGSALLGPFLVAALYAKWPEVFASGVKMAEAMRLESWFGFFIVGAPLLALGGLPFWWLLGAGVLWLERRKGKDLGELARDVAADAKAVLP